jgi:hypothetical protein
MLRIATGDLLQALVQNDGSQSDLSHGTPVHAFLAPDALRVLAGDQVTDPAGEAGEVGDSAAEQDALRAS